MGSYRVFLDFKSAFDYVSEWGRAATVRIIDDIWWLHPSGSMLYVRSTLSCVAFAGRRSVRAAKSKRKDEIT